MKGPSNSDTNLKLRIQKARKKCKGDIINAMGYQNLEKTRKKFQTLLYLLVFGGANLFQVFIF